MLKNSKGYIFESRVDDFGRKGIREKYEIFNNVATVEIGLDGVGKMIKPKIYTVDGGFTLLSDLYKTEEEIESFRRSKRATYILASQESGFKYMSRLRVNTLTGELKSAEIYIPIMDTVIMDIKTYTGAAKPLPKYVDEKGVEHKGIVRKKPGIIFYKADLRGGINKMKLGEKAYEGLINGLAEQVKSMDFSSKSAYLLSRL